MRSTRKSKPQEMQKVILDTNVIISALISRGIPSKILTLVLRHKIELQLSEAVFSEYVKVIMRPKFSSIPNFQVNAEIVINRIEELAVRTEPTQVLNVIKDENDNRFLELALATNADYLITGNSKDFKIDQFDNTIVLAPAVYWNHHHPDKTKH